MPAEEVLTRVAHDPGKSGFVYGQSAAIQTVNSMVAEIARTDIPVLIVGESGTGKDAYARLLHSLSPTRKAAMWKIDCGAGDANVLIEQLVRATRSEAATDSCNSIYLDNIHELDLASQRVLLSHLFQEGGEVPVGEARGRLIASTSRNLETEVETGRFRREFYFRINGASLRLPPLRERKEDISPLMEYFLNKYSGGARNKLQAPSNKVLETLMAYHWPGNIRELENLARKIIAFGDVQLALNDLHAARMANHRPVEIRTNGSPLKVAARAASKQAERELIIQALDRTRWNRKRAARELQISYKSLLYKIKQIGANSEQNEGEGRN